MSDLNEIRKNVSFLLDDSFRPSLIISMDGKVLFENEPFKMHFGSKVECTIDDIIDLASMYVWTDFIKKATESVHMMMEIMPINVLLKDGFHVGVQMLFLPEFGKIIAVFDVLGPRKTPSLKTYLKAFKQSSSFMLLVDLKGKIRDVNERHTAFINQSKEELIGFHIAKVFSLIDPDNNEHLSERMKHAEEQGSAESIIKYQKTVEDTRFYHIIMYYDNETKMFIIHMSDTTEKENLQVQLAHSGSLSAVGQIAASIAHEIRNPITTLKGFTQLLKASATEDSIRYITVIEDEIERMESILGEMLVLSKPSSTKKSVFSLEVLVGDMVCILHPKAVMEGIEVIQTVALTKEPLIYGDPDKIKQVLLNLFKNALESMKRGGKLSILLTETDGNLTLSVKDTGKGMTLNQVNQVFMPFFSSKPGGTGLGLPFVLKTVEEHGGTISVESQVEVGTKFLLTFPWAHDERSLQVKSKQTTL